VRCFAVVGLAMFVGACSSTPKIVFSPVPTTASLVPASTIPASASETTMAATEVGVTAEPTTTVMTTVAATASPALTAATSSSVVAAEHFSTLPVGATLPSDEECAARVRPVAEIRPANAPYNSVRGDGPKQTLNRFYARVTGNFTGTTDEIIQWAACKWGIDEDIVRAQAAKESGWFQQNRGDFTSNPDVCVPGHGIGVDGRPGECPESIGIMQVRYQYLTPAFPMATDSTAYNLDAALAARRSCFEGNEPWLNTTDRGADYAAGDLWGCVGMWFAGRWHTTDADTYMTAVQDYLIRRIWTAPEFRTWTPG
jgi:hypothetical protein